MSTRSVWREIDKSCVVGAHRYLVSIKCGPSCINDTQVDSMTRAIASNRREWLMKTNESYPDVATLDVVLGITYGTDRTTNNKENQILVKLLDSGFEEEDRDRLPGVLIDSATRNIRVYRCIGQNFWAFIGNPGDPASAPFVFLEVLLALAKALAKVRDCTDVETQINAKIRQLASALMQLTFPLSNAPSWVRNDFSPG